MGNIFSRFLKKKPAEKKLKYVDNSSIICAKCEKPKYMGYTNKPDSELCTCGGQIVYNKKDDKKVLQPYENFYQYE